MNKAQFEWYTEKDAENQQKHGVRFTYRCGVI